MLDTLVTSYISPDLDGFACAIAYSELLNKLNQPAKAAIYGTPHDEALWLVKRFKLNLDYSSPDPAGHPIILVDMSEVNGKEPRIKPEQVTEIIDHRQSNDSHMFPNAKLEIEPVGSAATLIAERYRGNDLSPTRAIAVLMHGAIISNTLNFKAKVTTLRDQSMAEWLAEFSKLPVGFVDDMFREKSDLSGNKLIDRMESEQAVFTRSGKRVTIIQLEIVDAQTLLDSRLEEIKSYLLEYRDKNTVDIIFITLIDLLNNRNIIYSPDRKTVEILSEALDIDFKDGVAIRPGFIMRKEIVPLLEKKILDNFSK